MKQLTSLMLVKDNLDSVFRKQKIQTRYIIQGFSLTLSCIIIEARYS